MADAMREALEVRDWTCEWCGTPGLRIGILPSGYPAYYDTHGRHGCPVDMTPREALAKTLEALEEEHRVEGMKVKDNCDVCHVIVHARRALASSEPSAPPADGCTCQGCGRVYRVDVLVPDALWEQVKPEGKPEGAGLLCGRCIVDRLEGRGAFDAFRLVPVDEPSAPADVRERVERTDEPMPQRYVFELFHSVEDEGYVAAIREPDNFGVSGFGTTPEDAIRELGEALAVTVEDMALPGPEPLAHTGGAEPARKEEP